MASESGPRLKPQGQEGEVRWAEGGRSRRGGQGRGRVRSVDYPLRQTMCSKFTTTTATIKTTPSITCAYFTAIVTMSFTVNSVYDKDSYSEEPDEAKVSRPVREWRRGR